MYRRNKAVKTAVAGFAALCLLFLNGCSGLELASVDSLMRPPKQMGENAKIEAAFESSVGTAYSLTAPLDGLFRCAYVVYDINNDGLDESLVFYVPAAKGAVHMNVIGRNGDEWFSACDIEGAGTQVECVEFSDLDGDGVNEIIVGWSLYEGISGKIMCVYRCTDPGAMSVSQTSNIPYSVFETLDIDNNGVNDILLLGSSADSEGGQRQYARFLDLRDGNLSVVGEAVLDPATISILSVQTDVNTATSRRRIYIDVACEDGSRLTQCLAWDSEKLVFSSPISDAVNGSVAATRRTVTLLSSDIDADGLIEMPAASSLEGSSVIRDNKSSDTESLTLITWLRVLGFSAVEAGRCIYNYDDGYMLTLAPEWGEVTAVSDRDNCTLKVYPYEAGTALGKTAKELFTIKTVADGQQSAYSAYYTELIAGGGMCLMYKLSSLGEEKGITAAQLIKLITAI